MLTLPAAAGLLWTLLSSQAEQDFEKKAWYEILKKLTQTASWGFSLLSGLRQKFNVLLQSTDILEPNCSIFSVLAQLKLW